MGADASRYLLLLLLVAAARGQSSPDVCRAWTGTSSQRIVGGTAASAPMPWMAVLHPSGTPPSAAICGATLINRLHVVTAAHCTRALDEERLKPAITLGVLNRCLRREANRQTLVVAKVEAHPQYTSEGDFNDIALLTLAEEAASRFTPACLPPPLDDSRPAGGLFGWLQKDNADEEGRWALVAGFGQTQEDVESSASCRLRCAGVRVFREAECARTALPRALATAPTLLCAGVTGGGVDSCQGDSGGGMILTDENYSSCKNVLIGVVAFGFGCGQAKAPGLYTRVRSFVPWLNRQMGVGGSTTHSGGSNSTAAPPPSHPSPPPTGGRRPPPPPHSRPPSLPFLFILGREGRMSRGNGPLVF